MAPSKFLSFKLIYVLEPYMYNKGPTLIYVLGSPLDS
jgi:hypothetical protein